MKLTNPDATSVTGPDGTEYAWKGGDAVEVPADFGRELLSIKDAGFDGVDEQTAKAIAATQDTTTTPAPKRRGGRRKVTEPEPEGDAVTEVDPETSDGEVEPEA